GGIYARINNYPAGQLIRSTSGEDMYIGALTVNPAFRRLEVGTALIKEAERTAPPDVRTISLTVGQRNLGAQALYKSVGFTAETYIGGVLNMKKILRPGS